MLTQCYSSWRQEMIVVSGLTDQSLEVGRANKRARAGKGEKPDRRVSRHRAHQHMFIPTARSAWS